MPKNRQRTYQYSYVNRRHEVNFTAATTTNYGNFTIPLATRVERFHDGDGKWSDWFVREPERLPNAPNNNVIFRHDAEHYGIRIPNENVEKPR